MIISGREIVLEDGSLWEVEPIGRSVKDALEWDEGDTVYIKPWQYNRGFFSYHLENQNKKMTFRGFFKKFGSFLPF